MSQLVFYQSIIQNRIQILFDEVWSVLPAHQETLPIVNTFISNLNLCNVTFQLMVTSSGTLQSIF